MEDIKNTVRGIIALILVAATAALAGWLYAQGKLFDSATAAWVQGIGTILAVLAATHIASRQGREAEERDERARTAESEREKRLQQARRRAALGLAHIARNKIQLLFTLISDPSQRHLLIKPQAFINTLNQSESTLTAFPIWEVDDVETIEAFSNLFTNIHFARDSIQKLGIYGNIDEVPAEEILSITNSIKSTADYALNNCNVIGAKLASMN